MPSIPTTCPRCEVTTFVEVREGGWRRWQRGALIQDCDMGISSAEAEMLISGYCGPCWDAEFVDDEQDFGDDEPAF